MSLPFAKPPRTPGPFRVYGQPKIFADYEVVIDWKDQKMGVETAISDTVFMGPWHLVNHPEHLVWKEAEFKRTAFVSEFMVAFGYSPEGKFAMKIQKVIKK